MTTMRWLLLLLAVGVCMSLPATAEAKVPCRNQVFNDWEHDGQIASTYPLACYRDALRHVPTTEQIYTSLEDDIRAALQARSPASTARRSPTRSATSSRRRRRTRRRRWSTAARCTTSRSTRRIRAQVTNASAPLTEQSTSGGGIPTPLLVLGGIALVLVGSGAVGHRRPPPPRASSP